MQPHDTTKKHPQFKNRVGQRFGRLLVIQQAECPSSRSRRTTFWRCRCDCGNIVDISSDSLRRGSTQSCGCLRKEMLAQRNKSHGMRDNALYSTWSGMIQRCTDTNTDKYPVYGGRGIRVCAEWRRDFKLFHDYVSQLSDYGKKGYTLDRIDNDGNYEPGNIRWASPATQARNQHSNRMITHNGKTQCLRDWANELGINERTLASRLKKEGDAERALTTPIGPNRNSGSRHRIT